MINATMPATVNMIPLFLFLETAASSSLISFFVAALGNMAINSPKQSIIATKKICRKLYISIPPVKKL